MSNVTLVPPKGFRDAKGVLPRTPPPLPLLCACKKYGPIHPWEPGEWCSPVRVVPEGEK